MILRLVVLLGFFWPLVLHAAGDPVVSVGVGKRILDHNGVQFERVLALGYQARLGTNGFVRPELGAWTDLAGMGRSSSGYLGALLGVSVTSGATIHAGVGPSVITSPDRVLGGPFQFVLEGGVGLQDPVSRTYLGVVYKHLSSAGLEMPNLGRDFLLVQLRLGQLW